MITALLQALIAKLFADRKIHEWRIDRDRPTSDDGGYWSINIYFTTQHVIQMLSSDTAWMIHNDGDVCSIRYSGELGDSEYQVVNEVMKKYLSAKPKRLYRDELLTF